MNDPWLAIDWTGNLALVGSESLARGMEYDLTCLGRNPFVASLAALSPGAVGDINRQLASCRIVDESEEWAGELTMFVDALTQVAAYTTPGIPHPLATLPLPSDWAWIRENPLGGVRWWRFRRAGVFTTTVSALVLILAPFAHPSPAWAGLLTNAYQSIISQAAERCARERVDWYRALYDAAIEQIPPTEVPELLLPSTVSHWRARYETREARGDA